MTAEAFDWDTELPLETADEVYRALRRALQRKQGFGLFFVQCTPAQGEKIVADLRRDLPQQQIQALHLEGEVTTLTDLIAARWQQQPFDLLVVEGLQASLYAYEDTKRLGGWSSDDIYNYSWQGVPKILSHLNQQRESLRDRFPARFVFLVPAFVVDYFIQRAADFIDWRSGLFRFPRDPAELAQELERFVGVDYDHYLTLTPEARIETILHLKDLQANCPDPQRQATLLFELGFPYSAEQDYGNAVVSWEKVLELKPDDHEAWYNRGVALSALGRKEEAIASYDHALEFKPDDHEAWYNRGVVLAALGRKEKAIASYDHALEFKPDDHEAWYNRGAALSDLGRKEEAIASYDHALAVNPDLHEAWGNRSIALTSLGRYEEALVSYNRVLQIKPDDSYAMYKKAACYSLQGDLQQATETLKQAIALDAKYRGMANTDSDFDRLRDDPRFQAVLGE